jgi:ATP-dependent RNA helicase DDX46/PRP5
VYRSTAVYGGAGVAEQIADLKRGTHIAVGTPGRMIDILTMQAGKILSLRRVSYVVLDEADRMFDMGFAPQISAILSAVRPDRQTVLFSATFPKAVEALARKSLKYPIEVLVGGRSVASDSVTQYGEVIEEEDKFLRLLQLLGEHVEDEKKVIIFVDTQVRADSVFEQLIRCGYPSLSLHGGKEQEDRDSTLSDFKRTDGPNVLVATSVAGRGLDVTTCVCVINYSAPNHLEDYVHRVGRTGRAGNSGTSYTFVNSGDESKYAPIVVRAMIEAGQSKNISDELRNLSNEFKSKVERGEARYAGSGFKGKGYTYDSSELNDAQKLARLEKRQALIEAGMIDPDEEDHTIGIGRDDKEEKETAVVDVTESSAAKTEKVTQGFPNLSADLLALPGMKEAMMKKAGIELPPQGSASTGNHFVEEVDINDYPREARWKVTQKETTSRLQDEFQAAVTLKGKYIAPNTEPEEGERRLYLHIEATTDRILQTCIQEIRRLLNEETLRVGAKGLGGGSHKYNVLK